MSFTLIINGQNRSFDNLSLPVTLAQVIAEMALKGDRVAVELNGQIVQRALWADTSVSFGDRLEVVHFVGGGSLQEGTHGEGICAAKRRSPAIGSRTVPKPPYSYYT